MSNEIKLRPLETSDFGQFSKIMSKMQVKEEVRKLFTDVTGKSESELAMFNQQLMAELAFIFIENYWKAEKEVHKLLANLSGKEAEEIGKMKLSDTINMLKQLKDDESFGDFFTLAVQ